MERLNLHDVGVRLCEARKRRNLTQYALAKSMGVGQGWISALERGTQTHIQADTVVRLCEALGCSADYLLGLTGEGEYDVRQSRTPAIYQYPI